MNSDKDINQLQPTGSEDMYNRSNFRQNQVRQLTPDELEVWNSCMSRSVITVGLPFGVFGHLLRKYISKTANKPLPSPFKQAINFGLNCFLGSLLYSPVCFTKLQQQLIKNEEKFKQMRQDKLGSSMGRENITEPDAPYSSNLDPKFDGPQGSFSHLNLDFSPPMENMTFEDDVSLEKEKQIIHETTYDELRQHNRENYKKPFYSVRRNSPNSVPESEEKNPVPLKPKNKYGDEME